MVYGLISDIHANLEALEAVLAELNGVEGYLCLGDLVGYGPDPEACLTRVRALPGLTAVVGNHDLAAIGRYDPNWFNPYARRAIEWTAGRLTSDDAAYLGSLPDTEEVAGAVLVHGSLPEAMDYVTNCEDALDCFDAFGGALCLVGHTHVAEYYTRPESARTCEQLGLLRGGQVDLRRELRYLINPGSIGQPRDGNPQASFGVYDSDARTVRVGRVDYDLAAVQAKMRAGGLPRYLSERLGRGV